MSSVAFFMAVIFHVFFTSFLFRFLFTPHVCCSCVLACLLVFLLVFLLSFSHLTPSASPMNKNNLWNQRNRLWNGVLACLLSCLPLVCLLAVFCFRYSFLSFSLSLHRYTRNAFEQVGKANEGTVAGFGARQGCFSTFHAPLRQRCFSSFFWHIYVVFKTFFMLRRELRVLQYFPRTTAVRV